MRHPSDPRIQRHPTFRGGPFASRVPILKDFIDPPAVDVDLVDAVGVTVSLSQRFRASRTIGGQATSVDGAVGQAFFYAPGEPVHVRAEGRCRLIQMHLPLAEMLHIALEDHGIELDASTLTRLGGDVDPAILGSLCRAHAEPDFRSEADRAIVARLLRRSGHKRGAFSNGGLAPARLQRVRELVDASMAEIALSDMASAAALSPFHFARAFRKTTGTTPARYVMARRVERALALLSRKDASLTEIASDVGFCSASHMVQQLRSKTGMTPARIRRML